MQISQMKKNTDIATQFNYAIQISYYFIHIHFIKR